MNKGKIFPREPVKDMVYLKALVKEFGCYFKWARPVNSNNFCPRLHYNVYEKENIAIKTLVSLRE